MRKSKIKTWQWFPHCHSLVWEIYRSPMYSPHKGRRQLCGLFVVHFAVSQKRLLCKQLSCRCLRRLTLFWSQRNKSLSPDKTKICLLHTVKSIARFQYKDRVPGCQYYPHKYKRVVRSSYLYNEDSPISMTASLLSPRSDEAKFRGIGRHVALACSEYFRPAWEGYSKTLSKPWWDIPYSRKLIST